MVFMNGKALGRSRGKKKPIIYLVSNLFLSYISLLYNIIIAVRRYMLMFDWYFVGG
jgi:hypothetical protein